MIQFSWLIADQTDELRTNLKSDTNHQESGRDEAVPAVPLKILAEKPSFVVCQEHLQFPVVPYLRPRFFNELSCGGKDWPWIITTEPKPP